MWCFGLLLLVYACVLSFIIDTTSCFNQKNLVVDMKYDVQLKLDPIDTGTQNTVEMYSKHGQKFVCLLPTELQHSTTILPPPVNNSLVTSLLSPLNSSTCLTYGQNWWTYELCFGRHVLQFHAVEHERTSETPLGYFESETNWTEPRNETEGEPLFHSQFYVNGSYCDLTHSYRRVEVRYACVPGDSFQITQVEERETCVYRMYVSAPTLCRHPSFSPAHTPRVEPIRCSPEVSSPSVSEDPEHTEHPASTGFSKRLSNVSVSGGSKRVLTLPAILKKMHIRRKQSERRFIRFLLKQFLRSITYPVLRETQLDPLDAFAIYLEDARNPSAPPLSRPWATYRSYLRRYADEFLNSMLQLSHSVAHISALHSRGLLMHSKPLSALYVLGTLTYSLMDAQLQYFEYPNKKPIYFPFELLSDIAVLFSKLSTQLLRSMSSDLADTIRSDLDMLLTHYNQSNSTDGIELVGTELNNVTVTLRLHGLHHEHPAWTITPVEIDVLRYIRNRFKTVLLLLKSVHQLLSVSERIKKMKTDLETTMENLLVTTTDFKILVVQSATRGMSSTEDANVDHATPPSESASVPSAQNVLEIVKDVMRRLSPETSQDLTIYETAATRKGTSVFVIMSGEEKGKEERRMVEMESAYNFKKPPPDDHNQPE